MVKLISWVVLNAAWVLSIYFGLYKEVEGAVTVMKGLWWLHFIGGLSALFVGKSVIDGMTQKSINRHKPAVPNSINTAFDGLVFCALLYFGYVFYAAGFIVATVGMSGYHSEIERRASENGG